MCSPLSRRTGDCSLKLLEDDQNIPAIHHSSWRQVIQSPSDDAPLLPSDEICAAIESLLGEIEPCTVYASTDGAYSKDGWFDIDVDMTVPGEHKLHVIHNGRHVHGSPCKINVEGFLLDERKHRKSEEDGGYVFATLPKANVKYGVYVPEISQALDGSECVAGVVLYTRGERGNRICLGFPCWNGDGEFAFDEKEPWRGEQSVEVKSCEQEWDDEEVMQMEFSYVYPQWTLELTHLHSGRSSTARGYLTSRLCLAAACVVYPENSPVYLLPAFF